MVARLLWEQNVAGSNPVSPTATLGNTRFSRVYFYPGADVRHGGLVPADPLRGLPGTEMLLAMQLLDQDLLAERQVRILLSHGRDIFLDWKLRTLPTLDEVLHFYFEPGQVR